MENESNLISAIDLVKETSYKLNNINRDRSYDAKYWQTDWRDEWEKQILQKYQSTFPSTSNTINTSSVKPKVVKIEIDSAELGVDITQRINNILNGK